MYDKVTFLVAQPVKIYFSASLMEVRVALTINRSTPFISIRLGMGDAIILNCYLCLNSDKGDLVTFYRIVFKREIDTSSPKRFGSSQLFVTLYTLSIYPFAHKQLRKHSRILFVNSLVNEMSLSSTKTRCLIICDLTIL